jgi:hypothetical protein
MGIINQKIFLAYKWFFSLFYTKGNGQLFAKIINQKKFLNSQGNQNHLGSALKQENPL